MPPRLFGTDGVRGEANGLLTAELALSLAVGAAHVLGEAGAFGNRRPRAVVGRDPRASGEFLEAAVVAGLASAGVDVIRVGVVPTPGLAYLVGDLDADLGVMLSASHNPMADNGIKFFTRGGGKLDDAVEDAIEAHLGAEWARPTGAAVGRVTDDPGAVRSYIAHLVDSLAGLRLDALKIVVDCAEGAASVTAVEAFAAAGAEVVAIHNEPDGLNINLDCGSTHLEQLQAAVVANGAHLGIALDGDADRCLAVDARGEIVDGDQILAILSLRLREAGQLAESTVVATVMSNLGFTLAMQAKGVTVVQTKVGDRYVLESMKANGYTLGGEQSGHVILSQYATTGDGVLTGLHLAAELQRTGSSLQELASVMTRLPQVLINVPNVDKALAETDEVLLAEVAAVEELLGETGRVLLRSSGTEPVVRVMVEAPTHDEANEAARRLVEVVATRLALD